ncbi:MAG: hypothetical protein OJF49_001760 [Ktedonobacterales bacterium]|nr:MAG: hypothetical protein OJF49_001760 [Ktedonobacterales bacterium]
MRYRYLVVYRPTPTGYAASVPELPGCVAAGDSLGETRELMRKALEWHLEDMQATGQDILATDPAEVAEYLEVDVASPASVASS